MKDLIVSTLILFLIAGGWTAFLSYAESQTSSYIVDIETQILPAVEAEDWTNSTQMLETFRQDWHRFRKTALCFLDTETISDIDYGLARAIKFTSAGDAGSAAGELNSMAEQLSLLMENQKISLQNIF